MGLMIVILIIDMMVPQGLAMYLGFLKCILNDFWLPDAGLQVFTNGSLKATISYADLIADLQWHGSGIF